MPEFQRLSGWWLLLIIPLSVICIGIFRLTLPRSWMFVASGFGYLALRTSISPSMREIIGETLRSRKRSIIAIALPVIFGIFAWNIWERGWEESWELLRSSSGMILIVAAAIGLSVAIVISMFVNCLSSARSYNYEKNALEISTLLFSEIVFASWFLWAVIGRSLDPLIEAVELETLSFDFRWALLVGLPTSFLAWYEGDTSVQPITRSRLSMCLLAITMNYKVVWQTLLSFYDWIISDFVVELPFNILVFLFVVTLITGGLLLFLIISRNFFWRHEFLNRLALKSLTKYFKKDPCGKTHTRLRHFGHLLALSPLPKIGEGFIWIWQIVWGKYPSWLRPKKFEGISRYERFLRNRLEQSRKNIKKLEIKWRLVQLHNQQNTEIETKELSEASLRCAQTLVALEDYLFCPFCENKFSTEAIWPLIEQTDRFLMQVYYLNLHESQEQNGKCTDAIMTIRQRIKEYYLNIKECVDNALKGLISFRLDILSGKELADMKRLALRDNILLSIPNWTANKNLNFSQFAVHALLNEFRRSHDWAGLIETWRLLEVDSQYTNCDCESNHLEVAEAWWHYAAELGPGTLGQWALQKAINHFYQAKAEDHLRYLPDPFKDAGSHDGI